MPIYTVEQLLKLTDEQCEKADKIWREAKRQRNARKRRVTYASLKNKERRADYFERKKYEQMDACAICNRQDATLYIDHNHTTDLARGLLCGPCNAGLGMFKENLEFLYKAGIYLSDYNRGY